MMVCSEAASPTPCARPPNVLVTITLFSKANGGLFWWGETRASQIFAMGAQAVSHGVAEEGSPRREPWGKMRHHHKPRQGDRIPAGENFLSPLRGSDCQYRNPRLTPWATFYSCSAAKTHRRIDRHRLCGYLARYAGK